MRVEELERELRAERPEASQDFARRLDEWAEAGFPRDRGLGPRLAERKGPFGRAWDRLTSTPPRRILLPAGAVATVVVVAGVVVGNNANEPGEMAALTERTTPAAGEAEKPATPPLQPEADSATAAPAQGSAGAAAEAAPDAGGSFDLAAPPGGGIARGEEQRIVDATAQLRLGAEADEVQDVANEVVEVTDRYNGVVIRSEVTSDDAGARASFELEVPYKNLDAALSDLSGLADVISRTEAGEDITARAVRARKDLAKTLDQIHDARIALIRADTREERLVLEARIDSLGATADAYETELNQVQRQGRFATVNVDVTSNGPASEGGDDGNWGLGDAVDDAGDVLETIGGIALVSLAILLPLSLVAALLAFAISRGRRRSRDRALDD